MFNLQRELCELLEKYPDPREGEMGKIKYDLSHARGQSTPLYKGIVVDNKDPECRGRIRVSSDMLSPGSVSPWLPVVHYHHGLWQLPDIGVQAIVAGIGNTVEKQLVLGFIYDEKHPCPAIHTQKNCDSAILQSKKHRIEILSEKGKEIIGIYSAQGKIRIVLDKEKGIEVVNELGDIHIECRKLTIESKDIAWQAEKVSIESQGQLENDSENSVYINCDNKIQVQGQRIELKGMNVTSEGKRIAQEGFNVMGFDIHQMEIPAGLSTAVVPLPHPFIGKLQQNMSPNVVIAEHAVAYKGSIAKHNSPLHMQLPGTIRFIKMPDNKGEVSGGTAKKLKINGKEAALVGSTVTTCNDIGVKDNSRIMGPGKMIPMPTIIHPDNEKEYEHSREEKGKEKKITKVKWEKTTVKEGEEVGFSAQVENIADGNMLTIQVLSQASSPEDGFVYSRYPLTIQQGKVSARWKYEANKEGIPAKENPKFIISAHSAWCTYKISENSLEVELRRPKIEKLEWQDTEGNSIDKAVAGEQVILSARFRDMEERESAHFTVYGTHKGHVIYIENKTAIIHEGKAELRWTYRYNGEELKEKPKYYFTVSARRCKKEKSGEAEIEQTIDITLAGSRLEALGNVKVCFFKENEKMQKESSDGTFKEDNLIPGDWNIKLIEIAGKDKIEYLAADTGVYEIIKTNYVHMIKNGIPCIVGKKQLIIIDFYTGISE